MHCLTGVRTAACLFALLAVGGGVSNNTMAQASAGGLWLLSLEASDPTCLLLALEIEENGTGAGWVNGDHFDPEIPDLEGKVKISGSRIETNMTAFMDAGKLRMSLRGTISGSRINAQVTLTEGSQKFSGTCVLTRK